ncbi:hypothetical protein GLV98_05635 [Halobacillus litoralis]|uniref:Uncharacterized protein n=1 Tax=Halobacillus litoralis TaxID=45668 RepID=A0A845E022_9BACI|nr:hypothetical protein [Halobacillus litoralis]
MANATILFNSNQSNHGGHHS